MKKGSQFITESTISKVRELIPALTRLCAQRSQDKRDICVSSQTNVRCPALFQGRAIAGDHK